MPCRKKCRGAVLKGVACLSFFSSTAALADFSVNLTRGVTSISQDVYNLHMLALGMVTVIAAIVFGIMFWSLYHHRKSRGASLVQFHHSTKWEVVWTVIPVLVLLAFAAPATKTLVEIEKTIEPDLTIKITGYQWRWRYDYLDYDFGYFSSLAPMHNEARQKESGVDITTIENYLLEVDHPAVIPVNRKVRLLTTANDVIHSWWVPALGWKRDAIPGYINDNWTQIEKVGTYRGQCAELCGKDHGYMPIVLNAVPEQEFQDWVAAQKQAQAAAAAGVDREWSMAELMERGQRVYGTLCIACHQADGKGIPPTFPALAGSAVATGPVAAHIDLVLNGKDGTTMQAFRSQLAAVDLAAVITYERNAFGNNSGDMVQPAAIQSALQGE
jgi:cytochrome c oxidase subunit 2